MKTTPIFATLLVTFLSLAILPLQAQTERPNIIFILVDDMGWSDLGCFGSEIETPHLDRLASEGLRMTQMHNTSKCYPSRACLLTGSYAQNVGYDLGAGRLRNFATLGDVLRTAGYATFASGKHHGADNLYDIGFDHYYGLKSGASNHFCPGGPGRPGEPTPAYKGDGTRSYAFDDQLINGYTPEDPDYYTTDAFTDYSIGFIEKAEQENDPQPWFLYLSYTAPHDPLHAWPEDIANYEGIYDEGYEAIASARYERQLSSGLIDETFPRSPSDTKKDWDQLTEAKKQDQLRRMMVYAAMVDRVDQNIGRLVTRLEELGELDNTLIMFASDNGANQISVERGEGEIGAIDRWSSVEHNWANVSNTPMLGYKNNSYEGGIATPFIAWWPGKVAPGHVSHQSAHFIDIMPTLMAITGATHPEEMRGEPTWELEGVNLMPIFTGQETMKRPRPLFFQWGKGIAVIAYPYKAVRRSANADWELFKIDIDRTETNDIADEHPGIVQAMDSAWSAWYERSMGKTPAPPTAAEQVFSGEGSVFESN